MTIYYYTFRSMTAAMTAAGKLKKRGIAVNPVRTPEHLRKRGCGYCIPIPEARFRPVGEGLHEGEYEKLYRYRDGEWREITL